MLFRSGEVGLEQKSAISTSGELVAVTDGTDANWGAIVTVLAGLTSAPFSDAIVTTWLTDVNVPLKVRTSAATSVTVAPSVIRYPVGSGPRGGVVHVNV